MIAVWFVLNFQRKLLNETSIWFFQANLRFRFQNAKQSFKMWKNSQKLSAYIRDKTTNLSLGESSLAEGIHWKLFRSSPPSPNPTKSSPFLGPFRQHQAPEVCTKLFFHLPPKAACCFKLFHFFASLSCSQARLSLRCLPKLYFSVHNREQNLLPGKCVGKRRPNEKRFGSSPHPSV